MRQWRTYRNGILRVRIQQTLKPGMRRTYKLADTLKIDWRVLLGIPGHEDIDVTKVFLGRCLDRRGDGKESLSKCCMAIFTHSVVDVGRHARCVKTALVSGRE